MTSRSEARRAAEAKPTPEQIAEAVEIARAAQEAGVKLEIARLNFDRVGIMEFTQAKYEIAMQFVIEMRKYADAVERYLNNCAVRLLPPQ